VDEGSGYRLYEPGQLKRARLINPSYRLLLDPGVQQQRSPRPACSLHRSTC
jgi:hypothetical protein